MISIVTSGFLTQKMGPPLVSMWSRRPEVVPHHGRCGRTDRTREDHDIERQDFVATTSNKQLEFLQHRSEWSHRLTRRVAVASRPKWPIVRAHGVAVHSHFVPVASTRRASADPDRDRAAHDSARQVEG